MLGIGETVADPAPARALDQTSYRCCGIERIDMSEFGFRTGFE